MEIHQKGEPAVKMADSSKAINPMKELRIEKLVISEGGILVKKDRSIVLNLCEWFHQTSRSESLAIDSLVLPRCSNS